MSPIPYRISVVIPIIEMASGLLILFKFSQRNAALFCIFKHAFIVVMLSPLVHNWNGVVIPWNIALAVLLYLFYVRKNDHSKEKPLQWPHLGIIFIVWIAPLLWYVGLWPFSLSFHLYSGYHNEVIVIKGTEKNTIDLEQQHISTYNLPLVMSEYTINQIHNRLKSDQEYVATVYYFKAPFEEEKQKIIYQDVQKEE